MSRYTVTPLGWQYAVRQDGRLMGVYDTKEDAAAGLLHWREMEAESSS